MESVSESNRSHIKELNNHLTTGSYQALLRSAFKRTGDWESAKDVVQDALLKFMSVKTGNSIRYPQKYLYKTIQTTCYEHNHLGLRRSQAIAAFVLKTHDNLFAEMQAESLKTIVEYAVELLPPKRRLAIHLVYYKNYSYERVAAILSITVAAAHQYVWRSLSDLKTQLKAIIE